MSSAQPLRARAPAAATAARASRGTRISVSITPEGNQSVGSSPSECRLNYCRRAEPVRLAGDALLRFGAAGFRLVRRLERAGHANGPLRLVPNLLIRQIAENRRDQQEDGHGHSGRVTVFEAPL